jgi:ATP-dependent DNA helicase RecQ
MVFGLLDRTSGVVDRKAAARTTGDVEQQHDEDLFELLREKRKSIADSNGIPPYTVFPDTTLMEMAYYFPKSSETLMGIYGVGKAKQKHFGKTFLKIITDYCEENDIEEKERMLEKKAPKKSSSKKHIRIAEAFNDGQTIEHLAEEKGVKEVTILKHLKKYLEEGNELRSEGIAAASSLSQRKRDEVMAVYDEKGSRMLRVAYDRLDKSVSYSELRVLQLYHQSKNADS